MLEAKKALGKQLQAYRKAMGLTQQDFAQLVDTGQTYISAVERGIYNPTLENLIRYADFYGVTHYQLADPKYPIPTFEQLPANTKKEIKKLRAQQAQEKERQEKQKTASRAEGNQGRAKQLHLLIKDGFFNKEKTAKETFLKLNPGIPSGELTVHAVEIGKITGTLSQGKFPKLLEKLEPAPGSTAVRFVIKDPKALNYPYATKLQTGANDMAAEEGGD